MSTLFRAIWGTASNHNKRDAQEPPDEQPNSKRPHTAGDTISRQLVPVVSRKEAANFKAQPGFTLTIDDNDNAIANGDNTAEDSDDEETFENAQEDVAAGTDFKPTQDSNFTTTQDGEVPQQPQQNEPDSDLLVADDDDGNPLYEGLEGPPGSNVLLNAGDGLFSDEDWAEMTSAASQGHEQVAAGPTDRGTIPGPGFGEDDWADLDAIDAVSAQARDSAGTANHVATPPYGMEQEDIQMWDEFGPTNDFAEEAQQDIEMFDLTNAADDYGPGPDQNVDEQAVTQNDFDAELAMLQQSVQDGMEEEEHLSFPKQPQNHKREVDASENDQQDGDEETSGGLFDSIFASKEQSDVIDISDDENEDGDTSTKPSNQQRRLSTPLIRLTASQAAAVAQQKKKEDPPLRPGADVDRNISPLLRSAYKFHTKAIGFLPNLPQKHTQDFPWGRRYWICILLESKLPKNIRGEKDFIWMKGNRYSTVRTVRETYLTTTFSEEEGLEIRLGGGEGVEMDDVVEELDYFGDKVICFRAVRVDGHGLGGKAKGLVDGLIPEVVELDLD